MVFAILCVFRLSFVPRSRCVVLMSRARARARARVRACQNIRLASDIEVCLIYYFLTDHVYSRQFGTNTYVANGRHIP